MANYKDRLQPEIVLTSPNNIEFHAKWIGNTRALEKQLAVFKTPGIKGVVIQDLEVQGVKYPLTIFFDGPDHDIASNLFFETCAEAGTWEVAHPVHGVKTLQLVSVAEAVEPVNSGGLTEFDTEWLEATLPPGALSAAQVAAQVRANQGTVTQAALDDFEESVALDTADQATILEGATDDSVTGFTETLSDVTSTVAEVQATVDSIVRDVQSTIFGPLTDILSLGGQLTNLVATPQLVLTDFETMLNTYSNYADQILNGSADEPSDGNINRAAVQDLTLTGALAAMSVATTSAPLQSRQSVIDGLEGITAFYKKVNDGLSANQDLYADRPLDGAYYSQMQSFKEIARMEALTLAYLFRSAFDLSVEKIITLRKPESPVMIAMREYGGPGENDANINLFYDSNQLAGDETLLLQAGKQVVVYL